MRGNPNAAIYALILPLVLVAFTTGRVVQIALTPHEHVVRPAGVCDLWIKDNEPTFICKDKGQPAESWKLRRDGSWQDIGPATDSNMGVPKS